MLGVEMLILGVDVAILGVDIAILMRQEEGGDCSERGREGLAT